MTTVSLPIPGNSQNTNPLFTQTDLKFHFNGYEVRGLLIHGDPWFCLLDVCQALDIQNHKDWIRKLNPQGVEKFYLPTDGGKQRISFISESNLYKIIFRSHKPHAKAFEELITGEIIPSIRKTGKYFVPTSGPELAQYQAVMGNLFGASGGEQTDDPPHVNLLETEAYARARHKANQAYSEYHFLGGENTERHKALCAAECFYRSLYKMAESSETLIMDLLEIETEMYELQALRLRLKGMVA